MLDIWSISLMYIPLHRVRLLSTIYLFIYAKRGRKTAPQFVGFLFRAIEDAIGPGGNDAIITLGSTNQMTTDKEAKSG